MMSGCRVRFSMILEAIIKSFPLAVGVALSPIPVAAIMIILMASRARICALAFLLGWVLGILVVGFVVFMVPGIDTARGEPTALSGMLRIVLGIILLFLSVRQWRCRIKTGKPPEVPKLFVRLDRMGAGQSWVAGFLLASVTPKNLFLTVAGAATIDASMLGKAAQVIALLVFAAVASLTVAMPVAAYFLARRRAVARFRNWKDWLVKNNVTIIWVLLIVFGLLLTGRGMAILAA
jgi:hypothetical protein